MLGSRQKEGARRALPCPRSRRHPQASLFQRGSQQGMVRPLRGCAISFQSLGSLADLRQQPLKDTLEVITDFLGRHTQNQIALGLKPAGLVFVPAPRFLEAMERTVDFHNNLRRFNEDVYFESPVS